MPVRTIALLLLPLFLCANTLNAETKDLSVLSDKTAKITIRSSWKCTPTVTVTAESADATFFEQRLNDLGLLFGAALSQLTTSCRTLKNVKIKGITAGFEVTTGQARSDDGWRLRLDQSSLTKTAISLGEKVTSYDKLPNLVSAFEPYRTVPGIDRTTGYALYGQYAQQVLRSMLANPQLFADFVQQTAQIKGSSKRAQKLEDALGVIALFDPQTANALRLRAQQIQMASLNAAATDKVVNALAKNPPIKTALGSIHDHLDAKTPDAATLTLIDQRLAAWLETEAQKHESARAGTYLDDVRGHVAFVDSIGNPQVQKRLPQSHAIAQTTAFWFDTRAEELLLENLDAAQVLIETSGEGYQDVDLILETGLILHEEFAKFGFEEEAEDLLVFTGLRIENAIEQGLEPYTRQVQAEEMTLDRVAFYREEADVFYELSQDYPGFTAYVEVIEQSITSGQRQACAVVADRLATPSNQDVSVLVGDTSHNLRSLTCALYLNGHLLSDLSMDRSGDAGRLTVLEDNADALTFEIGATDTPNVFAGVSEAWDDEMVALVTPPPSGKPDRAGLTECDVLAGDPNDPTLPTQGVVLENLDAAYDFDRALEACIAAVEHNPEATRQVYQLARILDFVGDAETAEHYAQVAASRQYAPAIHLQAFSILTYRDDDDAFFDAVDLLKVSAKLGFGPSKTELNELMPPGTDLFRERPPPSDNEILDAVGRKRCEGNALAKACSIRTGVAKKNCFQTGEFVYSCELVLRHRCTMSTGMDGDPLMRMFTGLVTNSCSPTTDPMFMKLTKNGAKWTARKEF